MQPPVPSIPQETPAAMASPELVALLDRLQRMEHRLEQGQQPAVPAAPTAPAMPASPPPPPMASPAVTPAMPASGQPMVMTGLPSQDMPRRIHELETALAHKDKQLKTILVTSVIINSPFLKEKTVLPPAIALEVFGRIFKVATVDGALKAVAHGPDGQPIMSRKDPSKIAEPEEALEIYVMEHYPERDAILRASHAGSGAAGNLERKAPAPKQIRRNDAKAFAANLEAIARGDVDVR